MRSTYSLEGKRQKGESALSYTAKKKALFCLLKIKGWELPEIAQGTATLHDAKLSAHGMDQINNWTSAKYVMPAVVAALRKLDRPMFNTSQNTFSALTDDDPESFVTGILEPEQPDYHFHAMLDEIFMATSTSATDLVDDDIIYASPEAVRDQVLEEDDAVAILANYRQVRQAMHNQELSRGCYGNSGYQPNGKGKGKGKGKSKGKGKPDRTPVRLSKRGLIFRSRCARCGRIGHWARECTNAPDARGAANAAARTQAAPVTPTAGSAGFTGFFIGAIFEIFVHDFPADTTAAPFVGLTVTVGYAPLDTGTQTGLIGEAALQEMASNLKKFKLQLR